MNVNVILVLVFFLSLMFLAMIFGERLSLFGFVDGRWFTAPLNMAARVWGAVCEATDRIWCFVFDHFWWVTATISGSIGVLLVALIMVSGLTKEAAAVRLQEQTVMPVGSVLDHTTVIDPDNVLLTNAVANTNGVAQLILQEPSRSRWPVRHPAVSESRPRAEDFPPLPLRPYREQSYSRGRLTLTMEPLERGEGRFEKFGQRIRSPDVDRLIDRTVASLRNEHDWRRSGNTSAFRRPAVSRPAMREDSEFVVDDFLSRVRVIPGDVVSANNLKVETFAPANPGRGDFEIQIRLSNLSHDRISGLVVRELLPAAWIPKSMEPRGVFRASTATWLVNDLGPLQDHVLRLQVESTESGRFHSLTEVSATAAVRNNTEIARQARPLPPVTSPVRPSVRSPVKLPDVRLTLESQPEPVNVGDWTTARFRVENVGDVPAVGVNLLITLAAGLDHHALNKDDLKRTVDWKVKRLAPGESRQMPLVVRPTFRGRHFATAELQLKSQQLALKPFEIVGRDSASRQPGITPVPDFR